MNHYNLNRHNDLNTDSVQEEKIERKKDEKGKKEDDFRNFFTNLLPIEERGEYIRAKDKSNEFADAEERLEELKKFWFNLDHKKCIENPFILIQDIFYKMKIKNVTTEHIKKQTDKTLHEIVCMAQYFYKKKDIEKLSELNRMHRLVFRYKEILFNLSEACYTYDPTFYTNGNDINIQAKPFLAVTDIEKLRPQQELMLYILNCLYEDRIKRYDGECYEPHHTKNNDFSHAYKRLCTLEEYIHSKTNKDLETKQWKNLTEAQGIIGHVIKQLQNCSDYQFPDINKNRNIFSFENGIFHIKLLDENNKYYCKFFNYSEEKNIKEYIENETAIKFFDMNFTEYNNKSWNEIPTPNFDKIISYQFNEEEDYNEIYHILFALLGRLFFEVGDLDDWQVVLFFKGVAGTGKGTVIKIIKSFFDKCDVGVISNNGEPTFGLQGLYDKKLAVAPEVKGNMNIDQATFQSMVSGESVSVAIKNQTSLSVKWTVPIILAGNELPNMTDNGGSLQRRLVIPNFKKKVLAKDSEADLEKQLILESPLFLQKAVKAYLDMVNKVGNKGFWSFSPQYFKKQKIELAELTNPFYSFLDSERIIFGQNYYMTNTEVRELFKQHCLSPGLSRASKFGTDLFSEPIATYREMYNKIAVYYGNENKRGYKLTIDYYNEKGGVESETKIIEQPIFYGIGIRRENDTIEERKISKITIKER